jgi:hypothetical protein
MKKAFPQRKGFFSFAVDKSVFAWYTYREIETGVFYENGRIYQTPFGNFERE